MVKIYDPGRIVIGKKKENDLRIFLDIDGVVANWMEIACKSCDIDYNDPEVRNKLKKEGTIDNIIDEDKLWGIIDKEGSEWWENLPLFPWSKDLYEELLGWTPDVCFLSSPSSNADSAKGKINWIKNHFDTKNFLIGSQKHFCANKRSLLIDDREHKTKKFEKYGGNVFVWPEGFSLLDGDVNIDHTMEELCGCIRKLG